MFLLLQGCLEDMLLCETQPGPFLASCQIYSFIRTSATFGSSPNAAMKERVWLFES
jgi:hypothetical protein